jgi:hypothetical protein
MVVPHANFDFLLTSNAWIVIGISAGVSFWIGFIHASLLLKKSINWIKLISEVEKTELKKQYEAEMAERKRLNDLANENPLNSNPSRSKQLKGA